MRFSSEIQLANLQNPIFLLLHTVMAFIGSGVCNAYSNLFLFYDLNLHDQHFQLKNYRRFILYHVKNPEDNIVSTSYFIDYQNTTKLRNQVAHFLNGPLKFAMFFLQFDKAKTALLQFRNVVVTSHAFVLNGGNHIQTTSVYQNYLTGMIVAHIYQGVTLGLPYEDVYGHVLRDSIIPLTMMPKENVDNSVIVCRSIFVPFLKEVLPIMGFKYPTKMCVLEEMEAAYVDNLYMMSGLHNRYSIVGLSYIRNFSNRIKEFAGVKDLKPTVFLLTNREPGKPRHIVDFDKFVEAIRKAYPAQKWTVKNGHSPTLVGQAKDWSAVQMVVSPGGSNNLNIIFMPKGGVIVYFRDPMYADVGNNCAAVAAELWALSVPYHGWEDLHFKPDPKKTPINIRLGLEFVGHGLFVLKNQCWPKNFSISRRPVPVGNNYGGVGLNKTIKSIYSETFWPELYKDVDEYQKLYGKLPKIIAKKMSQK